MSEKSLLAHRSKEILNSGLLREIVIGERSLFYLFKTVNFLLTIL